MEREAVPDLVARQRAKLQEMLEKPIDPTKILNRSRPATRWSRNGPQLPRLRPRVGEVDAR